VVVLLLSLIFVVVVVVVVDLVVISFVVCEVIRRVYAWHVCSSVVELG